MSQPMLNGADQVWSGHAALYCWLSLSYGLPKPVWPSLGAWCAIDTKFEICAREGKEDDAHKSQLTMACTRLGALKVVSRWFAGTRHTKRKVNLWPLPR